MLCIIAKVLHNQSIARKSAADWLLVKPVMFT